MKFHNYCVIDFETGGIDKKNQLHAINHPPTEVACLGLSGFDLTEIGRYESYIKGKREPKFKPEDTTIVPQYVGYGLKHIYQKGALTFTNITIEKLESEGKDPKQVCLELCDMFEKFDSGSRYHGLILVGHNIVYDIPFLQFLFHFYKKDLSKYLQGYFDHLGTFHPVYYDTMFLSRSKSIDENQKHSLIDTASREHVEIVDAHRAINDVIPTSEVFKNFILQLRNSTSSGQVTEQVAFREKFSFEY